MAGRPIRSLEDLRNLSEQDREERSRALRAVTAARRDDFPLDWAAEDLGIDLSAVRRWAPDAVGAKQGKFTYAAPTDTVLRFQPLVVEGEMELVPALGTQEAKLVNDAFRVQWAFMHGDADTSELEPFEGVQLPDGRVIETDPDTLSRIAMEDPSRLIELNSGDL